MTCVATIGGNGAGLTEIVIFTIMDWLVLLPQLSSGNPQEHCRGEINLLLFWFLSTTTLGGVQMNKSFTTACCGDRRLNQIIGLLDSNRSYRKRDLGTPFDFTIDQGALLVWHSKLTGFPVDKAPISDALVLLHTDCLAVQTNAFFTTLWEKRCQRHAMTHDGDIDFCTTQLDKIKVQAERLSGPIHINWHFGVIDTEKALCLGTTSRIKDAIACILWPFGVPSFFVRHLDSRASAEHDLKGHSFEMPDLVAQRLHSTERSHPPALPN